MGAMETLEPSIFPVFSLSSGTYPHTAFRTIKRGGKIVYSEARTFDRLAVAVNWAKKLELLVLEEQPRRRARDTNVPGHEIVRVIAPLPQDVVIDKQKASAFYGTPLVTAPSAPAATSADAKRRGKTLLCNSSHRSATGAMIRTCMPTFGRRVRIS
jgi:hypothetical protein